jgi:hypothetical protein
MKSSPRASKRRIAAKRLAAAVRRSPLSARDSTAANSAASRSLWRQSRPKRLPEGTRPERGRLHCSRWPLRGQHLGAIVTCRTTVGVPHLFDHVQLRLFHLRPLRDVGAGDDPLGSTAATRQFLGRQRISPWQDVRGLDGRGGCDRWCLIRNATRERPARASKFNEIQRKAFVLHDMRP